MLRILFLFIFSINLFAQEFTVASYNVENLFDLKKDRSDYSDYIPNTKTNWNQRTQKIKINNIIKVLKDINTDIVALQEIENLSMLKTLQRKLPKYKYLSFSKYKNSSVGIGFLSSIKIVENKDIKVQFSKKIFRPILETTFKLQNYKFKIFNNHWPSKRVAESFRIKYAKTLYDRLKKLPKDYDYILLGDFNSNYDEFKTIYRNKKLNNTQGITGINQVLNTTIDKRYVSYDDVLKQKPRVHYNLWLDLEYQKRFSNKYRGRNNTPDNIILSPALFDNKKITYITKSFKVFKAGYLYKNGKILRWGMKNRRHEGKGFSDHLPIFAKFTINKKKKNPLKDLKYEKLKTISDLYKKEKLIKDVFIKNAIVIYKNDSNAIIKQKNNRAIYFYKNAKDLKEGYIYDLNISQIKDYNGLKEVDEFTIVKIKGKYKNYKKLYLDAKKVNILDKKYQNEILINLEGMYKRGKLYYIYKGQEKKIKIFAKNKDFLPKNESYIKIKKAHLGFYKSKVQVIIHKKKDILVQ